MSYPDQPRKKKIKKIQKSGGKKPKKILEKKPKVIYRKIGEIGEIGKEQKIPVKW
jgi:hypothetical protein